MAKRRDSDRDAGERQPVEERSDREQVAESISARDQVGVQRGDAAAARDLMDGDASSPTDSEDAQQDEDAPPAPTRAPSTGDTTSAEMLDGSDVAEGRLAESADPLRRASTWDGVREVQREGMFDLGLDGYDQPRGAAADAPADHGGRPTYSPMTERAMELAEKAADGDENAARQLDELRDQARRYRQERTGTSEAEVAEAKPPEEEGFVKSLAGRLSDLAQGGFFTGGGATETQRAAEQIDAELTELEGGTPTGLGRKSAAEQAAKAGSEVGRSGSMAEVVPSKKKAKEGSGEEAASGGDQAPKEPSPDGAEGTTPEGDPLYDVLKAMQEEQLAGAYPGRTRGGDIDPSGGEGGEDTTSGQVSTDEELKDPEQDRSPGGAARVEERPTGTVDHLIRGADDTGPHTGATDDVPEVGTAPPSSSLADQDPLARFRDAPARLDVDDPTGRSRLQDVAGDDASSEDPFAGFDPDPTAGLPAEEPEPVEDPDHDPAGADRADGDVRAFDEADDDASPMRGGEDLFDLG